MQPRPQNACGQNTSDGPAAADFDGMTRGGMFPPDVGGHHKIRGAARGDSEGVTVPNMVRPGRGSQPAPVLQKL